MTWVVWIDREGKWHCYREGYSIDSYSDKQARNTARLLVGELEGSASFVSSAITAYCVHSPNRSKAISLVRQAEKIKALKEGGNLNG